MAGYETWALYKTRRAVINRDAFKAQHFGMESTYQKYNLDMSLSEGMWCWISDS